MEETNSAIKSNNTRYLLLEISNISQVSGLPTKSPDQPPNDSLAGPPPFPRRAPLAPPRPTRYPPAQSEIGIESRPCPLRDRAAVLCPQLGNRNKGHTNVAKTSPVEFIRQVRSETRKVAWPTRRETIMTGVMVMIMTVILGLFFFVIDKVFDGAVAFLLSLATK